MTDRTKIDNASQDPARINGGDGVSVTRRRLVKGSAAAVPVVLTLRSGAAAALVSNQECVEHDRQRAVMEDPPGISPVEDVWVRKLTTCNTIVEMGGGGSPETLVVFKSHTDPVTMVEVWLPEDQKLDNRTFKVGPGPNQMEVINMPGNIFSIASTEPCFVLAHVVLAGSSDTGATTIFGKLPTGDADYNPITVSCWCSINPNFNLP